MVDSGRRVRSVGLSPGEHDTLARWSRFRRKQVTQQSVDDDPTLSDCQPDGGIETETRTPAELNG